MAKKTNLSSLINYIETKIKPHRLSEIGKNNISLLLNQFNIEDLYEAIDISFRNYIRLNDKSEPIEDSVNLFLQKIGGIAHNNQLSPIEKKLRHIRNICAKKFYYWNDNKATIMLKKYIKALEEKNWTEEDIINDLSGELMNETNACDNWTQWRSLIEGWTNSLLKKDEDIDSGNSSLIKEGYLEIKKKYKIIKQIGSGSFGITYLVKDLTLNKNLVLKEFSSGMINTEENKKFFEKFIKEIQFLFDLHHENIISIYDYVIDIEKQIGYYIMEYIDGSNIFEYIKNQKQGIDNIFLQLINVFMYLETNKICHRDIRINNILITKKGIVKLIDFGFVKDISESNSVNSSTQLISYPYDWPEELKDKKAKYDNRTEIYFIGKMIIDILEKLSINDFQYTDILYKMAQFSYSKRYTTFGEIDKKISNKDQFLNLNIDELRDNFSNLTEIFERYIIKIDYDCNCEERFDAIIARLKFYLNHNRLDKKVTDFREFFKCFLNGNFEANDKYLLSLSMADIEKLYYWLEKIEDLKIQNEIIRTINKRLRYIKDKVSLPF